MASKIARPGGETPARSKSITSTGSQAAQIYRATVVTVNIRDYTVDVQEEAHPFANHFDIPWMVPYVHQAQGEGVNVMPEVGSSCWVCHPSEPGRQAFILGWTVVQEQGTYRGGRALMNPGDLFFSTRDGNFVSIRRGGIVQIGSTPACQTIYIPLRNTLRQFSENYELSTPGGDLSWEVNRTDEQGDGHRGTLFSIAAKEYADDPNKNPIALLKIGSHGEGNDTILSLETRDKGGGSSKTKLEITKKGAIIWTCADDATLTVKGNLKAIISKKTTVTSQQDLSLASQSKISATAPDVILSGNGASLDLSGAATMKGSAVNLGDARGSVVIDTGQLTAWMMAVTALLMGPPTSAAFKGPIIPPVLYLSTKVKA